jgi:hypothetical protein
MLPFDLYPDGGRQLMKAGKGASARHEYGSELMQRTGQRRCAYCETDLTATYQTWLTMVVDHVIPIKLCKSSHIRESWCWDYSNAVLACAACNGFCNRYSPSFHIVPPETLEAFYDLRDKIFNERKKLIAASAKSHCGRVTAHPEVTPKRM